MLIFKTSENTHELQQIIDLQESNLPKNISEKEKTEQGFVTVKHTLSDLQKMQTYEPNIIVLDDKKLATYILAMTKFSANDIPILQPMFRLFETINFKQKTLSSFNYLVVGQVCVAKPYRGKGIFDKAYRFYKQNFASKYEICITEISVLNQRSLKAHQRIGFEIAHQYTDNLGNNWLIVVWEW